jgi:hypothetical protein
MFKLIFAFAFVIVFSRAGTLLAQTSTPSKSTVVKKSVKTKPLFTCKQIIMNDKVATYLEDVNVKAGTFEAKNAQKATFDPTTNKIVVYGCKAFTADAKVITHFTETPEDRLEYVIGSGTVNLF